MSLDERPWLMGRPAILMAGGATAAIAIFFQIWPEIDRAVATAMWRLHGIPALRAIGDAEPAAMSVAVALFAGLVVLAFFVLLWRRLLHRDRLRALLFILATFAIGPGLIVNVVLKDHWGRPRPVHTVVLGGTAAFVPVLETSRECGQNCSFVSGDVSAAIAFLAVAMLLPPIPRRWASAGILLLAVAIGAARMVVGAHFLSDLLLAAGLTILVMQTCYRLIMPRRFD
jgi:membrane-associated phospholipid phosphatase